MATPSEMMANKRPVKVAASGGIDMMNNSSKIPKLTVMKRKVGHICWAYIRKVSYR